MRLLALLLMVITLLGIIGITALYAQGVNSTIGVDGVLMPLASLCLTMFT